MYEAIPRGGPGINNLYTSLMDTLTEDEHPFKQLGGLQQTPDTDPVLVFQDTSRQCLPTDTLSKLLEDETWRQRDFHSEHIKLALLITDSFYSLNKTFSVSLPDTSSFVFWDSIPSKGKEKASED